MQLLHATRNAILDYLLGTYLATGTGDLTLDLASGSGPQNVLVSFTIDEEDFGSASMGTSSYTGVPLEAVASASGTIAELCVRRGTTVFWEDHSVGLSGSGANLELPTLDIVEGVTVRITSWTVTLPASE